MNAAQNRLLVLAARRALTILEPNSVAAVELQVALTQRPPPSKAKSKVARYGPKVWREGRCLNAADARAFAESVHAHFYAGGHAVKLDTAPSHDPHKTEREAIRERLSYCACGGKASDHREDKDGNLLTCSHC